GRILRCRERSGIQDSSRQAGLNARGNSSMPGGRIDTERAFTALGLAVLTISDSRDAGNDTSGDLLAERITAAGHHLRARALVRDDKASIQRQGRGPMSGARRRGAL